MNNIVIIGAGKEGKAYLGEVYDAAKERDFFRQGQQGNRSVEGKGRVSCYGASEGQDRAENYNRV